MKATVQLLKVEVYAHGGWWKDADGRIGQVPDGRAGRGPLATVAALTNTFGLDGWRLIDVANGRHNTYLLTFDRAHGGAPPADPPSAPATGGASITLG